jgi:predicted transcriptional regulator
LQPAAGRRRRHHVAGLVDDVEMHGVADHFAHAADGRLARAHAGDELGAGLQLHDRAEALDRAGPQLQRRLVGDELRRSAL